MRPIDENVKRYMLLVDMKHLHTTSDDPNAICLLHPREDYKFDDE